MKVCPECDEVYRGEETYCPRDGTKLEARESFEESDRAARLGPVQDLARADDDADEGPRRFKGRLADGTDVIVTVLERAELVDAASHRLPDLLETLTGPLPRSVLSYTRSTSRARRRTSSRPRLEDIRSRLTSGRPTDSTGSPRRGSSRASVGSSTGCPIAGRSTTVCTRGTSTPDSKMARFEGSTWADG